MQKYLAWPRRMVAWPRHQSLKNIAKARRLARPVLPQARPCSMVMLPFATFAKMLARPVLPVARPCQVPNCLF